MSRIVSTIGAALFAVIALVTTRAEADSIVTARVTRRTTADSIVTTSGTPRIAAGRLATSVAITRTASDSIATNDAYLPAVNITGATGVYRTDVWIFNPETSLDNDVSLYFTPADVDGTHLEGIAITPSLAPRESVSLTDIVRNYFDKTETYGLLEIRGTYPLMVTSNTYNVAGAQAGTYGQYSPGQPYRSALGFDDSVFGDLYVTGLTNDPKLRTNAVVMNPSEKPLEAGVQLVDAAGIIYGTRIVDSPAVLPTPAQRRLRIGVRRRSIRRRAAPGGSTCSSTSETGRASSAMPRSRTSGPETRT